MNQPAFGEGPADAARWTFQDATTSADLPWFAAVDEKRLYVSYSSRLLAFDA